MFFNSNIIEKEECNTGRQLELDVAKAYSIFIMIIIHCLAYSSLCISSQDDAYLYIGMYLGMAAPIFLFSMGITMCYTRNKTYQAFIKRGIHLLLLGFIINILYFLSNYGAGIGLNYALNSLLANDVLQFAGLSFILIGIFKKYNLKNATIMKIALVMSLIGTIITGLTFDNLYLTQFVGNFVNTYGINIVSAFPLFNWFLITVLGLRFGSYLRRCNNKTEFYRNLILPLAVICIVGFITFLPLENGMFDIIGLTAVQRANFFQSNTLEIIYSALFTILTFAIIHFIIPYIPDKIKDLILFASKNITIIYIIQWILILSILEINLFLNIVPSYLTTLVTILGVIILSLILTRIYLYLKKLIFNK